jgi:hypothetical protein
MKKRLLFIAAFAMLLILTSGCSDKKPSSSSSKTESRQEVINSASESQEASVPIASDYFDESLAQQSGSEASSDPGIAGETSDEPEGGTDGAASGTVSTSKGSSAPKAEDVKKN